MSARLKSGRSTVRSCPWPLNDEARLAAVPIVVGVLAVGISVGAVQQVVRTGEAGSRALWTNNFSSQPRN
jgi:hypothetical protein